LRDLPGDARYERAGIDIAGCGLYLDLPASHPRDFELQTTCPRATSIRGFTPATFVK